MSTKTLLVIGILAASLTPTSIATLGDVEADFVIPYGIPTMTRDAAFVALEGVNQHTVHLSNEPMFERWTFTATGGEAAPGITPPAAIEIHVYGGQETYWTDGWNTYTDYDEDIHLYTCQVERPCPVGVWGRPQDTPCPGSLTCLTFDHQGDIGLRSADYHGFYPARIQVVATSGIDIHVRATETTPSRTNDLEHPLMHAEAALWDDINDASGAIWSGIWPQQPEPEPTTTEGATIHPASSFASWATWYWYDCDDTIPSGFQRGTGFRLEGLDGIDYDVVFAQDNAFQDYGRWQTQFYIFEATGNEWGNVPEEADRMCIHLKDRDQDAGAYRYRFTDGLPRFADGDHSDYSEDYAPDCSDVIFCAFGPN